MNAASPDEYTDALTHMMGRKIQYLNKQFAQAVIEQIKNDNSIDLYTYQRKELIDMQKT